MYINGSLDTWKIPILHLFFKQEKSKGWVFFDGASIFLYFIDFLLEIVLKNRNSLSKWKLRYSLFYRGLEYFSFGYAKQ